jgi:hypothetical protein
MALRNSPPGPALEWARLRSLNDAIGVVKVALDTLEAEVARYRRDVSRTSAEMDGLMGYALAASGRTEQAMAWIERRLQEIARKAPGGASDGD